MNHINNRIVISQLIELLRMAVANRVSRHKNNTFIQNADVERLENLMEKVRICSTLIPCTPW